jgi:hypothetical protein
MALNEFTVNGTAPLRAKSNVQVVLETLEKLSFKELVTTAELAKLTQLSQDCRVFRKHSTPFLLTDLRAEIEDTVYWGSTKTIKELKKQYSQLFEPRENAS